MRIYRRCARNGCGSTRLRNMTGPIKSRGYFCPSRTSDPGSPQQIQDLPGGSRSVSPQGLARLSISSLAISRYGQVVFIRDFVSLSIGHMLSFIIVYLCVSKRLYFFVYGRRCNLFHVPAFARLLLALRSKNGFAAEEALFFEEARQPKRPAF
uniref:7TM_GPCR_Srx domain-containing protein n=1 Tax=Bursaphelenchus xylophilus TaxID=6326 RepID=A0A1I7RWS7_BURXY